MAASRATMEVSAGKMAREMASNMVKLAEEGQWGGAENIAARLRSAVLEVPGDERHEVLVYVSQCLERVKTSALCSRSDVATKMSEVRRGRDAAKAYGSSLEVPRSNRNEANVAR